MQIFGDGKQNLKFWLLASTQKEKKPRHFSIRTPDNWRPFIRPKTCYPSQMNYRSILDTRDENTIVQQG